MRLYKRLLTKCLLIIVAISFFGCEEKDEFNKEKITITLMHGWGGNLKNHKIMQEIYDEFSNQNEDIELICKTFPHAKVAVEKANDMLAVDKMPDIISTNGFSYYEKNAVKKGRALDLMPYIEEDEELREMISEDVLDVWGKNGEIYTIPDAIEVIGYWYNEEIFKDAGIVDEKGDVQIPKTWKEFFDICEKIENWSKERKNGIRPMAIEINQIVESYIFARLAGMGEAGMEMVNSIPDDFSGEAMEKVVKDIGLLYKYSDNVNSIDNARQYFKDGKIAIYFNGIWDSDYFIGEEIEKNIAYSAYPSETGESIAYISPSSGYVIKNNSDSRKREASIRFIKYILSDEVQKEIALKTGQAPSSPRVDNEEIKEEYKLLGEGIEVAMNADIRIRSLSSIWNGAYGDILVQYLPEAYKDESKYLDMIQLMNKAEKIEKN